MNKAFLISTVTAVALGYAAGFASNGLTAQAAVPHSREFNYVWTVGPSAKTAILNWVQTNGCPKLDTELVLSGGAVCDASKDLRQVCFSARTNPTTPGTKDLITDVTFLRAGTYTPAEPQ